MHTSMAACTLMEENLPTSGSVMGLLTCTPVGLEKLSKVIYRDRAGFAAGAQKSYLKRYLSEAFAQSFQGGGRAH